MKKQQTEMTNDQAKLLLSGYRHNGADAQDPFFREALEQAARDPELAGWFAAQRSFDTLITEKLHSVQPPATLKSAILTCLQGSRLRPVFPLARLLPLAAVLILGAVLLVVTRPKNDERSLAQYQNAALGVLSEGAAPKLDLMTSDLSRAEQYLARNQAPRASEIPATLRQLTPVGCRVIAWNGRMMSLTCFSLPDGELLHMFVIDAKSMGTIAAPDEIREINGWHVKFQSQNGMLLMLISKAPIVELSRYI
jgi:hypothetical protein